VHSALLAYSNEGLRGGTQQPLTLRIVEQVYSEYVRIPILAYSSPDGMLGASAACTGC
jgi:hypothetical protein